MRQCRSLVWLVLNNLMILVISESYYSIIAPGVINPNRKYAVAVTLHDANEPATIKVSIDGPSYQESQEMFVRPHETKNLEFEPLKLVEGNYNLTVESRGGIQFRNHTMIYADVKTGPNIYIQTDRAVYKPGDSLQFRVVMLDQHAKPLKILDPIRIEILDGQQNRIKQFTDIVLVKGVYTGKFQISQYPVTGKWRIKVYIGGNYDYTRDKEISVQKYILPKFSVYIKGEKYFIPEDRVIKVAVYGKYTFDKYVEGNVTATILDGETVLQQKQQYITTIAEMQFRFDNPKDVENRWALTLRVELEEKNTGLIRTDSVDIYIHKEHYDISVDTDLIQFRGNEPYRLKAKVTHWNESLVLDRSSPIIMQHGSKEYSAYLDENSEAWFEFDHEHDASHVFRFKDSTYEFPNIYVDGEIGVGNDTTSYCRLRLKGDNPRLGNPVEIEVSSLLDIPYLVYTIVGHGKIVEMQHIKVPANQKMYTLKITPTLEMNPVSVIYVHYIQNGNLRYDEMQLKFPLEFENQISLVAPKEARPGQEVTIDLKAQRRAYVCVLAVDSSVFHFDSSYDLEQFTILNDLYLDRSYLPFPAEIYPGLLSGLVTFTNAHYTYKSGDTWENNPPSEVGGWTFRKKFPETWIFENYEITDVNTQLTLNIPDTITTWRITAFSVHEVTGFGMVKVPTDIVTIKPFFITLNLPYSVKRGEMVSIPITIFNYHNESVVAEIIMYNEEQEFDFVESNKTHKEGETKLVQRIPVPANGIENVAFLITPQQVGDINLRITAENPQSSDAILQKLRVEAEGVVKHHNKAMYISVPPGETFKTTLSMDIPADSVPSSEYVAISLGGDTLVPTLKNLNNLVVGPTGCGEQNMANFAPNILVLNYLKANKMYPKYKKLAEKAKKCIEVGYQQQLTYRHSNGSYSVFGEQMDGKASTWLTAYTIRFFIKAEGYLNIESNIIESGLEFLAATQLPTGDFPFTGFLLRPAQQNRFGFTAFVLLTFLEDEKYASKYQSTIRKGLDFINNNLGKVKDIYALSIVATALEMAKHSNSQRILNQLHEQQIQTPDLRWWSEHNPNRAKDIEITAYILTAQLHTNTSDASDDLLILKWLVEQRNERGGFRSTHDTVVGLQALVTFSEKYNNLKNVNMQIQYAAKTTEGAIVERNELTVDASNVLVLQTEELPKSTRQLEVQVTGSGYSLLQLSYRYNMLYDKNFKHFQIQPTAKMLNADEMLLAICFSYRAADGEANMIVMECNIPSGFAISEERSRYLLNMKIIQRIELTNAETTLTIYFEKLPGDTEHCFDIKADRIHDVMLHKPTTIIVYDYYNITRYDAALYTI